MVHDADHKGVTNAQLMKEGDPLTSIYTQSTAELNSLDLAWGLLMEDQFAALRREIYATEAEFLRFRQLMVNIVLATDIMDKSLGALRKERWGKAFAKNSSETHDEEDVNRKATIVLEHLIQASDVAHTMQHWVSSICLIRIVCSLCRCLAFLFDVPDPFGFFLLSLTACLPEMERGLLP